VLHELTFLTILWKIFFRGLLISFIFSFENQKNKSFEDCTISFSVSDNISVYPTIRYTGRLAGDPLGQMTIGEQTVVNGSGSQTGSAARWGDYSMMSVDPSDDSTFWYTQEYIQTTGFTSWRTRIASFNVAPVVLVNVTVEFCDDC